ncbi:MAG TPA: zinc-binding dehydrogenase [Saprospiraceae bacterium]|nr:zinc-binding dehydrogenase [Saprospiraceae bacterium]
MHGMMLWGPGERLVMSEITPTLPPVGEVFIKLHSAALNKRDFWILNGKYPGVVYPLIPGTDGAGTVDKREVIINPGINWGSNTNYFAPGFKILGSPDHGTLAQMVKAPEENLFAKPSHLSWNEAAALPVAGVTAYRAIFTRGRGKPGEKVLITGIGGGVATMGLLFAVANEMEVWVTSSSDQKIEKALLYGAKGGSNYTNTDWEKDLAKKVNDKFDLVIDGSGSSGLSKIISLMNPGGRVVIYGGTAGVINELSPQRIFWKQLDILGTSMGSPEDFQLMVDYVTQHKIKPIISHTFPLSEVNEAIDVVGKNEQFGKVCIEIA